MKARPCHPCCVTQGPAHFHPSEAVLRENDRLHAAYTGSKPGPEAPYRCRRGCGSTFRVSDHRRNHESYDHASRKEAI